MSNLVPTEEIERLVGAKRHSHQHLGRAVSSEQTVYVLHSWKCRESGIDLRECEWSLALDRGIDPDDWKGYEDRPVVLAFRKARLFPVTPKWLPEYITTPGQGTYRPCAGCDAVGDSCRAIGCPATSDTAPAGRSES